ncbi:MAG TPA: multicopper oxidase domain-containing protein [Polyangia bacterium]
MRLTVAALATLGLGCEAASDPGTTGAVTVRAGDSVTVPQTPLQGTTLPMFVEPLTTFNGRRVDATATVNVNMQEFQQKVLPAAFYTSLPAPYNAGTYLWGYNINGAGASWPARTIEAKQNIATTAIYNNSLVNTHLQKFLTVDQTIHWADPLGTSAANNCVNGPPLAAPCTQPYAGPIPAVVHLHGFEVLSQYDGHPDAWWTPGFAHKGKAFVTNTYNYPNSQEATTLWFHDHTLGIVRLNVYSGLEGFYFIRDNRDTGLSNNAITLPSGPQEAELMLADRQFDTNGQLYFPDSDNPANLNGPPGNPDKHPFWIPEFFGDVITVNGKSWPTMEVQPRRYRFRFVNGSNARFFIMQMFNQAGVDMHQNGAPGPAIWQIGSDGGLFNNPVKLDDPANGPNACAGAPIGNNGDVMSGAKCLFIAPAERTDVIVDFAGQAGKTLTLKNFAVIPFPSGGPVGFGGGDPTADGLVMQFKVDLPFNGPDTTFNPAGSHPALRAAPIVNIKTIAPNKKRQLILVEEEGDTSNPDGPGSPVDDGDPVESLINNTKWNGNREGTTIMVPGGVSNGHGVSATETPQEGSTELWEVANLTGDAHPIHIHLIQFQVISRQPFDVDTYLTDWMASFPGGTFNGFNFPPGIYIPGFGPPLNYTTPNGAGAVGGNGNFDASKYLQQGACAGGACPSRAPDGIDSGWKDTIKMFPGEVTRIAVRWAPQDLAANATHAGTDYFPFDPTNGPGYIEHCHILDHEDNEFMRPMIIAK